MSSDRGKFDREGCTAVGLSAPVGGCTARKLGAGAQCGQSGKQEAGGLGWVGGSISEPHGAALLSWLVLRLWLGRTGGWKSLPLSKCVPPPTMRAAALSHLLPVAGCICRAAGGHGWVFPFRRPLAACRLLVAAVG